MSSKPATFVLQWLVGIVIAFTTYSITTIFPNQAWFIGYIGGGFAMAVLWFWDGVERINNAR
jgi:hypothetical protein